jgi:Flp pilus assembly pilin Flp
MIMAFLKSSILHNANNKRGQTLVEYALILAIISVVAISSLMAMGGQVKSVFTTVNRQMAVANNGGPAAAAPPASGP